MLRCLVLTDDDKKQRFRKLIHKRREKRRKHYLHAMMPPLERIRPIQPNISIFTNSKPDNEICPSLTSNQPSNFAEQKEKTNGNKCWSSKQEELALPQYMGKFGPKDQTEMDDDRSENMARTNMCVNNIHKWNDSSENKNTMLKYFNSKIFPHIIKCQKDEMKPVSGAYSCDIGMTNVGIDLKKKMKDNVARNMPETADCKSKASLNVSSYVHKKFGLKNNYLSSESQNIENEKR